MFNFIKVYWQFPKIWELKIAIILKILENLQKASYQPQFFIILMGEQMMKQLLKETQMLLMIVT